MNAATRFPEEPIDCSDDFSGPGIWTQHSGNVYKATRAANVTHVPQTQVYVDDVRLRFVGGNDFNALGAGKWGYESGAIYVNIGGGDPGDHTVFIGNWKRRHGIRADTTSHLIIDGFTILRASEAGVFLAGPDSLTRAQSVTIQNCDVSRGWKQGIYLADVTGCLVTNNKSYRNFNHGIYLLESDLCGITHNTVFRCNADTIPYIKGGKVGIKIGDSKDSTDVTYVNVDYNVVYENQDTGIDVDGAHRVVVRRNVSYRNGDHGYDNAYAQDVVHMNNIAFRNDHDGISIESTTTNIGVYNSIFLHNAVNWATLNVITENPTYYVREMFVANTTGFVSDHNILVGLNKDDSVSIYKRRLVHYGGTFYETLGDYQATGKDGASYSTIPTFNDTTSYDFTIADNAAAVTDNVVDAAQTNQSGWLNPMWLSADPNGIAPHDAYATNDGSGSPGYADIGVFEYDPRPGPGTDFHVVACDPTTEGQYRVEWTAVGDDSAIVSLDEPGEYAVKGSASSITEGTWGGLSSFASPPAPLDPGQTQVFYVNVASLTYLRFKSKDENGHWSGLSTEITINPAEYGDCGGGWYGGGGGGCGGCGHEGGLVSNGSGLYGLRASDGASNFMLAGENTILNGTPTGTRGADLLPIESVQDDTGAYLTHLRVSGRSGALVDGVKLLFVDHPVGTDAFACGSTVIAGRRSVANQATTETGEDVTKLLNGSGHIFNAASAATVTISTPLDAEQTPLVIECGNGGARDHAIIVESQSQSGWQEVGAVYPRQSASATVIDAVPAGPVRLRFTGYAHVRSVARLAPETENVTSTWGTLETARSSSGGDVLSAIGLEDAVATALVSPDTLRADFLGPALSDDRVRSLFLGISATRVTALAASQAAAQRSSSPPTQFALYQNSPNPFWGATTIRLDLPVGRMVKLEIFDVTGRRVRTLVNRFMAAGRQSVVWNQRDDTGSILGAGVYFTELQVDSYRDRKKVILMP